MDEKVIISLSSVALGWFLAQGAILAKDWWGTRKLKNGLLTELEDIQDQLQRVVQIHARQLQIFALKGIEPTSALPIQNMFFKQYFKEVFSQLNQKQRISYQLIHATLDSLNKNNEDLATFTEKLLEEQRVRPDEQLHLSSFNAWGNRVIALYKTAMDVRWHIAYHLRNPESPTFDFMGAMHESYLKFEQDLDQEVKDIIEKAKRLKKEEFEKIYDKNAFSKNRKQ